MPQAQVYQVQPNQGTSLKSILIEKIQLKKEKTSQGMCDKISTDKYSHFMDGYSEGTVCYYHLLL